MKSGKIFMFGGNAAFETLEYFLNENFQDYEIEGKFLIFSPKRDKNLVISIPIMASFFSGTEIFVLIDVLSDMFDLQFNESIWMDWE